MNRKLHHPRRLPRLHFQSGLSLIECLIALVVVAIAAGLCLPSFGNARERRHLDGAAAQLETDMQLARSEAVRARHTVRLRFSNTGGNCYVMYVGASNACSCRSDGSSQCTPGVQVLRTAALDPQGVTLQSNVNSMVFDPIQGTVSPTGTVRLTGSRQHSVRVVINLMGRIRTCTPAASLSGYKNC